MSDDKPEYEFSGDGKTVTWKNPPGVRETGEAILLKAIEDFLAGNYPHPRHYRPGKCPHGHFYWAECEACNEKHFDRALDRYRAISKGEAA